MSLIDDFKARFPQFPSELVDQYFPALVNVWPYYFGCSYEGNEEIVLQLLAHLFSGAIPVASGGTGGGVSGPVQSKSVGSVSVSYAAPTQSGGASWDFFRGTPYGQLYWSMLQGRRGAFFV